MDRPSAMLFGLYRQRQAHKRLMVVSVVAAMAAATFWYQYSYIAPREQHIIERLIIARAVVTSSPANGIKHDLMERLRVESLDQIHHYQFDDACDALLK